MENISRAALSILSFLLIPCMWIVCNITFPMVSISLGKKPKYTGFIFIFNTWLYHWKSGDPLRLSDDLANLHNN